MLNSRDLPVLKQLTLVCFTRAHCGISGSNEEEDDDYRGHLVAQLVVEHRIEFGALREEFSASPLRKLSALGAYGALSALKGRLDPRRYNGASMVGLAGVVVKSHGSADEVAFANAVSIGIAEARQGLPSRISAQMMLKVTSP